MVIKIDFQSDEALYIQLRNQIILGIATSTIQEGGTKGNREEEKFEYEKGGLLFCVFW